MEVAEVVNPEPLGPEHQLPLPHPGVGHPVHQLRHEPIIIAHRRDLRTGAYLSGSFEVPMEPLGFLGGPKEPHRAIPRFILQHNCRHTAQVCFISL